MGGELQSTTTMTKKKKKKGRPSLLDLQKRSLKQQQQQRNHQNQIQQQQNPNFYSLSPNRRSTRQNPNFVYEYDDDDDNADDDDERRQKKHRPLHGLDNNNSNSGFDGSDSLKRRRITHARTGSDPTDEKVSKATGTLLHGLLPVEFGPTTPLPDKKLLVFVLDRLQKKDTYGVFSEPVDPEELPDYHDIIAHPMDFATVRKKLDGGAYASLEDFEKDVLLICSNAMQYNSPDTIYFRQARSIQELAKKDFENLRQDSDDSEPQPQPQLKVVRRGRPPKNLKKSLDTSPSDRIASEFSSDATLANVADNGGWSSVHNLRKGPMPSFKFRPAEVLTRASHGFHAADGHHTNLLSDWENEFPASVVKAVMKYGKKHFPVDENKRDTYMDSLASDHEPSVFTTFDGELKQLMVVGLHTEHGYARSLARFAADLGPVAWKHACRKIQSVLPNGVNFGPGWVGDKPFEQQQQQQHLHGEKQKSSNNYISGDQSSRHMSPATPGSNSIFGNRYSLQGVEDTELIREVNSQSESTYPNVSLGIKPAPAFQIPSRPVIHTDTNGFSGGDGFGFNCQPHMGMSRHDTPLVKSTFDSGALPSQMHGMVPDSNHGISSMPARPSQIQGMVPDSKHGISSMPASDYTNEDSSSRLHSGNSLVLGAGSSLCTTLGTKHQGNTSWQGFSVFHKQDFQPSAPPDLNARFLAPGSPIATMQIGSPQQPDLALQL